MIFFDIWYSNPNTKESRAIMPTSYGFKVEGLRFRLDDSFYRFFTEILYGSYILAAKKVAPRETYRTLREIVKQS